MRIRIEEFVAELFHPYVGTSFSFRTSERPETVVQLQLREVCPAPAVFDPQGHQETSGGEVFFHCCSSQNPKSRLALGSTSSIIRILSPLRCC
jgi:hypothetical protein